MKNYEIVIEIPKDSSIKYEFDHKSGQLVVDRFLFGSNVYPGNYGYIPDTLELDGDPVDVLVVCSKSVLPGSIMSVRLIGALKMIDDGDRDTKLIGVFNKDIENSEIKSYKDLNINIKNKIVDFFKNYKNLENKITQIGDWVSKEEANDIVLKAFKRFEKNKDLINLGKTKELKKILDKEAKKE